VNTAFAIETVAWIRCGGCSYKLAGANQRGRVVWQGSGLNTQATPEVASVRLRGRLFLARMSDARHEATEQRRVLAAEAGSEPGAGPGGEPGVASGGLAGVAHLGA